MNSLRDNFESWANDYWEHRPDCVFSEARQEYTESFVQDAWQSYCAAHGAQQAEIDRLMLEFCPGEMTAEQMATWECSQKRYEESK